MLITDEQIRAMADGSVRYVSCDYCGKHSALVGADGPFVANEHCPNCGVACYEAGEGWETGFYGVDGIL